MGIELRYFVEPKDCLSTHGGSGYCEGSYWDGDTIVCGLCGTRIKNPQPTSQYVEFYSFRDVLCKPSLLWKWWTLVPKNISPRWPGFIRDKNDCRFAPSEEDKED